MDTIIFAYTRKEALEDGEQVAIWDDAFLKRISLDKYKYPIFVTRAVWSLIERAVAAENEHNDLGGVWWDILWMSQSNIISRPDPATVEFQVKITGAGDRQWYTLIAQCGPMDMDDPAPVVTIMFPEDM